MSKYETLLFDFGGTLDADGVPWMQRFHAHYCAEGLTMSLEAFAPFFYPADDQLVGTISRKADLSATVAKLISNLEAELDRENAGDLIRGRRAAVHFLGAAATNFIRNRPLLERLSQRYRLGIVSNFYGNLETVCEGAGLAPLFGVMADSQRIGAEKPDAAIFRAALEPLGAVPERTLFIGDSLRRDREGARRMGMDFVWIAPAEAQQAETRSGGVALDHPAVTRLTDLGALLL